MTPPRLIPDTPRAVVAALLKYPPEEMGYVVPEKIIKTKTTTTARIIAVLQAHERGEKIERQHPSGSWSECRHPIWNFHQNTYRVATPSKTIPLTPADVPPGSVVRQIGAESWASVTEVSSEWISFGSVHRASFDSIMVSYEILRPGGVWEPARKTI